MKNKFKYNILIAAGFFALTGCGRETLDVPAKGKFDMSNYYQNYDQAYAGLVAVYDIMKKNTGGFESMVSILDAGSDDQYAGGGSASDGAGIQGFSTHSLTATTVPESYWADHYQGVARANVLLQNLPKVSMDDATKARFTAEAKTLRALYYFNLVRLFKNIPLILQPLDHTQIYDVPQAKPEEIYAQMEKDLTEAIPALPIMVPASESGRLSQGAAKALLGKIYLYDGKKSQAAQMLADVNGTPGGTSMYGYKLLPKFSDLWVTNNRFNSESIIEAVHTSASNAGWSNWGSGSDEGNALCVMVGPRSYTKIADDAPDLPSGWAFDIFTQEFYDFIKNDPRFSATVFDAKSLSTADKISYVPAYLDTGYFLNKFLPTKADISTGGGDSVLNYAKDSYIIRLADTYLMEAEALGGTGARAQALLDAVRARVGLASVPVSMVAIKNERRAELAGEGHRFFDLVRWGDAPTVLANRGFNAGVDEVFPIPYKELQNTKIVQNPGY